MKPSNYIFTYRSHLNYRTFWQRHYCETPEDIVRLREKIGRDHGQVEEIEEELNEEENED
jgi:hypothetical protein